MSDFSYTPDFVVEGKINYKTQVTQFESGTEQRRKKWANPKRQWTLHYKNRTSTEMSNVRTFFAGKYGAYSSFTWTSPLDSTEYTVRFDDDSFAYSLKAYGIYDFSIKFIEVK